MAVFTLIAVQTSFAGAADSAAGGAKYKKFCVACHGATGAGDGPASAKLKPQPKALSATTKSDTDLAKIIKDGGEANGLSAKMRGFGKVLSDEDVANVVAFIRTLK